MPTPGLTNKRRTADASTPGNTTSSKRSRVSRACDQCRTAREKCDGQPLCSTCATSKRGCTYTANPKKRGIQPGYIRTLELALTWLFNHSDAETILNQKLALEGSSSVLLARDTKESNRLHKTWRRTKFCKDVDTLLSGGDIGQENRSPESDDQEDTDSEEPQLSELSVQRHIDSIVIPRQSTDPRRQDFVSPKLSPRHEATSLPANRWRLFDVYFAYIHSWFPISEKHDVLKLTYSYPDEGLQLSAHMQASGDHAELWSILALASLQDEASTGSTAATTTGDSNVSPARLYDIARSLIPLENSVFEIGHAKALLLLAIINISQAAAEAAWLLVGYAVRILVALEHSGSDSNTRWKHTFAGGFLLDNLISLQLQRAPYLQFSDLERVGKVSQDGLEEWQPWSGCFDQSASGPSRHPVFSLSTFNNLVEITGIMSVADATDNQSRSLQEAIGRIERWKASLPPSFDYLRNEHTSTPATPPAILLQLLYIHCSFRIHGLQASAQRIVDVLEGYRDLLGIAALPPILPYLFSLLRRTEACQDSRLRARLHHIEEQFTQAWTRNSVASSELSHDARAAPDEPGITQPTNANSRQSFRANFQIPTPESIQISSNPQFQSPRIRRTGSTLLEDLLPDMNPGASLPPTSMEFQGLPPLQDFDDSQLGVFNPPLVNQRNSTASRDMDSFFDEMASLDSAEKLENQPLFMQNLGFAPDANIADFLSANYGHLNSLIAPFMAQGENDVVHMDPSQFLNGG